MTERGDVPRTVLPIPTTRWRTAVTSTEDAGNLLEDAACFWLTKDTDGNSLTVANMYVIRFAADQIPKVKSFWSLALYDQDFQLPQDLPMERHNRNSRASGMKTGADGSLAVYLQADDPGKDRDDNWLPTPKSGEYFVILRTYSPEGDILTGDYTPPPVEKVK